MPFARRALGILCVCVACLGAQPLPKFMGRHVTIIKGKLDGNGFPVGPASVCIAGPPKTICYTAPKDFGRDPKVEAVELRKDMPALLFSAGGYGVSGWPVNFALLVGPELQDILLAEPVSNQSGHAFWNEPSISESLIFLTANYVWGPLPQEGHYGDHRYIISAYFPVTGADDDYYHLQDRFMTVRRYDVATDDIFAAEKPEILARLQRVKSAESAK